MNSGMKAVLAVIIVIIVIAGGIGAYYALIHKAPAGNTLIMASSAPPTSIDPAVAFDTNSVLFDDQIYQTLVGYGTQVTNGVTYGSLKPVPDLATSWTQTILSNNTTSIVFNLRQNVTFSNGDAFNASDVQFSLDRVITMAQGGSFHVSQFLKPSGITVLGTYKIMVNSSAPNPWFLDLFQLWITSIVDPSWVNANGGVHAKEINNYTANHAMGTGPYMLGSYTTSQIVLTANPKFYGPQPNVTKIIYQIVSDPSTQQAELKSGSINVALNIPLDQMPTVKGYTGVTVSAGPTSSEYYIGMDENVSPFGNLDVRKAVNYAVNASLITANSTFGYGINIQSVIAPSVESYTPVFAKYAQNITKAQYYMKQAGNQSGFTTNFYYTSGDPIGSDIATILQSELKAINITLNLNPVVASTFNNEVGLGKWAMFYDGWVNLLANPDDGIRPLFSSQNLGIHGNYNYFNNSTVTSDVVSANKLNDISQRDALYINAQNIIANQSVEVPLFNLENVIPMTSNVHNLYIYPTFDIYFANVTMTS